MSYSTPLFLSCARSVAKRLDSAGQITDLHIYNLDAVPPVYVVWNHVDTDELTTANG